ncbi:MAG: SRPBCC family protein [Chloroflexota bacterium]
MRYKLELLIHKTRAEVWEAFASVENIKEWQPALMRIELISGTTGQPSAVSKLMYKENEREFSLSEKVMYRDEPNRFESVFENDFAVNMLNNIFIEQGRDQTLWVAETKYIFKTLLMKVVGPVLKKNYVARSQRDMERFKEMVERE